MQRPLLTTALVLAFLVNGCKYKEPQTFPQESDAVFHGAERKVVRPFRVDWVVFYYENETVVSLSKKVSASEFFISEGWRPFHHLKQINVMASGRGKQPPGHLSSIQIVPGKYEADFSAPVSPVGSTLVLQAGSEGPIWQN